MRLILLAASLLLAAAAASAGQLYKWVDADGNVHYTDQLPPRDARNAERKRLGDKATAPAVPFSLQEAMRKFPVTLFIADDCGEGCKSASAYLAKRGIPHDVKNARDPAMGAELMALTGGKLEVPVMTVGSRMVRGYEEGEWGRALDAAGYPGSAVLPKGTTVARQVAPKAQAADPAAKAAPSAPGTGDDEKTN